MIGFYKKIAKMLYISKYTVKKVLKIYRKQSCIVDPLLKKADCCKIFNGKNMKANIS